MFGVGAVLPGGFDADLHEAIERGAAVGFDGFEFFDWEGHDAAEVIATADANDMEIAGTLGSGAAANIEDGDRAFIADPESHDVAVADVERSIEGAAEVGTDVLVVTVGPTIDDIPDDAQHRAIVRVMREVAPTAEDHDVTVVMEPLNTRVDHPGYYLSRSAEAFQIVEAVDSTHVKVLFDVYHQQITEGDVVRSIQNHVGDIGHIHVADNPGRHEPGTGELDYGNIFAAIAETDYDGFVNCEFGPTGDAADAYEHVVDLADAARHQA